MSEKETIVYLVDGSSYMYRAFYAIPNLSTSSGIPTNATYGFVGMLNRILKEKQPKYLAVVFDAPGPTFRHELSPEYKAHRPRMPEDLAEQIPLIKRVISALGIPSLEMPGYEADDVIGTVASWASRKGAKVVMISGDKDLLQLVTSDVRMWDTMKDETFGPKEVEERFGVPPSQLVEIMGLMGDSIDNVPGVPGIGPKTAQKLIEKFGTIDNLLHRLEEVDREKERQKLEAHAEQATMSRDLVKIRCDVFWDEDWQRLQVIEPDWENLLALYRELEFKNLLKELGEKEPGQKRDRTRVNYQLLSSTADVESIVSTIENCQEVAISVITTGNDSMDSDLVGVALAWTPSAACYIPLGQTADAASYQAASLRVKLLAPLLSDPGFAKIVDHSKLAWIAFKKLAVELSGITFDPILAAYVLDPGKRVKDLEELVKEYLNDSLVSVDELVGTGRKKRDLTKMPAEELSSYAGDRVIASLRLAKTLVERIRAANQIDLLQEIEMPLVKVLARMEMKGVKIDVERLAALATDFSGRLEERAAKIYELAGEKFNINSPQQLGSILFGKLGLPQGKKTKTGYSTSMEVLATLTAHHPLPEEILHHRSLAKLLNTYVNALPAMVNAETGRIHTSYNQTATVTGRLSSSEPNLQNIPVRTEEGRKIRQAFVAAPGHVLVSADYSQIELRILAHYSADEALLESFHKGEDVHRRTAAEIFGVQPDEVTDRQRRQAKTINFGIIYGMGPYRLARDLGIPQKTARQAIERYFERYQGVRSYTEEMPKLGREQGFVTTLFQRKRFLPDLHSRNRNVRHFAERTAINTPIQGSAADIIKLAMVRIDKKLETTSLPAHMIMQVHDELVFEVEASKAEDVATFVQEAMESVATLAVPLKVETGIGANWDEAH
jgi:DNA polymerase-1